MITEIAPAKINLYLHVGPARADGLHELSSLFVFAEAGDAVTVERADRLSLKIGGPFAGALAGLAPEDNLVFKAARLLQREYGVKDGAEIAVEKRLPVAAGVGGGSADAAAALRALTRLWRVGADAETLAARAFALGADVPACLAGRPVLVAGAGEILSPGPDLPPLWTCLVNPRVEMPTGTVFRDFDAARPAPAAPAAPALEAATYGALTGLLSRSRNDLEPMATARAPVIASVLDFLHERRGALGARMSGSGATCFALFETAEAAAACAAAADARGWWAMASRLAGRAGP